MINTKIKNFIRNHSKSNLSEESCGLILEKDGQMSCLKCENVANDKVQDFQISLNDYLNAKEKYNILYIYHSHINDNEDFSEIDKLHSNEIAINYILYHVKSDKFKIYESNDFGRRYIGRFYEYKKYDCFTLVRDFYREELKIDLKFNSNIFNNRLEDIEVYQEAENHYAINNFVKIDRKDIQKYDLLLLNSFNKIGSHFAIYSGDDKILHQPLNSFSRIDNYCNFYKRNTVAVYRRR